MQTRLQFDWEPFSVVAFDDVLQHPRVDRVVFHHFEATRHLLEALRNIGYARIGLALTENMDARVEHGFGGAYHVWAAHLPRRVRVPAYLPVELDLGGFGNWVSTHRPEVVVAVGRLARVLRHYIRNSGETWTKKILVANLSSLSEDEAELRRDFERMGESLVRLLKSQETAGESGIPAYRTTVVVECALVGVGNLAKGELARRVC